MIKEILSSAEAFWTLYGASIVAMIVNICAIIKVVISAKTFVAKNKEQEAVIKEQCKAIKELTREVKDLKTKVTHVKED